MTTDHYHKFLIERSDVGKRLDEVFASRFGSLSRMRIASLLEAGACLVNGAVGRAGYRTLTGDSVEVSFDDGVPTAMSPEPIPLEIIHEDEHLIVIVKPAGMLVHPTMSVKSGTLANALTYHLNRTMIEDGRWNIENLAPAPDETSNLQSSSKCSVLNSQPVIRPGIVHRLDRATSGLMVIARTQRALAVLSRHFRKRLVEKRYLAWVQGLVQEEAGLISAPIGRDPEQRPHWRVIENGKPAETRFKVLERMPDVALLELEPVTGRTNQLRIHCAHIGHPIVGDEMHGNFESRITNVDQRFVAEISNQTVIEEESETRLCLHAWKLAFHHPANGEWLEFTASVPDDITKTIERYTRAA